MVSRCLSQRHCEDWTLPSRRVRYVARAVRVLDLDEIAVLVHSGESFKICGDSFNRAESVNFKFESHQIVDIKGRLSSARQQCGATFESRSKDAWWQETEKNEGDAGEMSPMTMVSIDFSETGEESSGQIVILSCIEYLYFSSRSSKRILYSSLRLSARIEVLTWSP
jgi:hypothetical protein